MSDPKDPVREGIGCLLQALAVALILLAYGFGNFLYCAGQP